MLELISRQLYLFKDLFQILVFKAQDYEMNFELLTRKIDLRVLCLQKR